jgi:uncharacterized protein YjbI with pentapeptide repeats
MQYYLPILLNIHMVAYNLHQQYKDETYHDDEMNFKEFESCTFTNCDFSGCTFIAVTFIDCHFYNCNFNNAKINHVAFRTVHFNSCQIKDVNFAMCDKFIFEIHFKKTVLDFSKFYALNMKGTTFTDSSLVAVDFMGTDITDVLFNNCDLYRAEFDKAIASKADFRTSHNYSIDPSRTKIKKAQFTKAGLKGLLTKYDIVVV